MDFGSFLRQRHQKQLGSNDNETGPQSSWSINRPFPGVGRGDEEMNGPLQTSSWNQQDPYEQNTGPFNTGPTTDPYQEPSNVGRGRGFRRGGMGPNSFGRGRGKGSFGRGMKPELNEYQSWDPSHASFGQQGNYGDESGYYQDNTGNDGYAGGGHEYEYNTMKMTSTSTGQDGNLPTEPLIGQQQRSTVFPSNIDPQMTGRGGGQIATDAAEEKKIDVCDEVKKKPDKIKIVRTDEEIKALEDFDIMQVNINWEHFGITKRMLMDVSLMGKQPISAKKNFDVTKLEFYCKLCDVQTVSPVNMHSHLIGKKHKMKAEQEVDVAVTGMDPEEKDTDKSANSYGGTIGFSMKGKVKDDDNDDTDDDDKEKLQSEKDAAYEKQYYETFDMSEVNVDWKSAEITESMLKEANLETKFIKYEDRCFDVFNLQFYCKLCDVQSTSTVTFYDHLSGKKHKTKATKEMNPYKPKDMDVNEEAAGNELSEYEKTVLQDFDIFQVNLNWDHYNITKGMLIEANTEGIPGLSQKRKKKKEINIDKLEFYCKLCASQMVSAGNFHDHLVGKKHVTSYQEHLRGMANPEEVYTDIKPEELGHKSILETIFKDCPKPVVGLGHITELHSTYDIWCICHLCAVKFRSKSAQNHVLGVRHRLFYMKKYHDGVYETLKRLHGKDIPFYRDLDTQAKKAAATVGSGKPAIKNFADEKHGDKGDESKDKDRVGSVQEYIQWLNAELDECKAQFQEQLKGRSLSPIFTLKPGKNDDKAVDDKPKGPQQAQDSTSFRDSRSPPPNASSRGRPPHPNTKVPLLPHPNIRSHYPPEDGPYNERDPSFRGDRFHDRPALLRDRYLMDADPLMRDRHRNMDPLHRDRFLERDPLLRERYMGEERDPLMRKRYLDMERDPLLRERYLERERDPLLRERYMDREEDPHLRERFRDREKDPWMGERYREEDPRMGERFRGREENPWMRDRHMDREENPRLKERHMGREDDPMLRERYMDKDKDPPLRERYMDRDRDPMFRERYTDKDRDPLIGDRDMDSLYRDRRPDPESSKLRPSAEPYLDPDPLKRQRRPNPPDLNPPNRTLNPEPYIDPDPLKRVLPSQKAKAKPVVIDYGHGKEEKSEKSRAKEWEDDINDILDSGSKTKGPDSLALLSSSYSSPKRELSPPRPILTKPLPFERSYLDRVKDFDLVKSKSRKKSPNSPYYKRRQSRSPDISSRNPRRQSRSPDISSRNPRRQSRSPDISSRNPRRQSRSPDISSRNPEYPSFRRGHGIRQSFSPPLKNNNNMGNFDRISISSESPPWMESPSSLKRPASPKRPQRYVKSPKFKDTKPARRARSRTRSSSSSSSSSSSRSRSPSPPRSSKYLKPKSPTRSAMKSKPILSSLKQSRPRSKSPLAPFAKSLTAGPLSTSKRSKSPPRTFPISLPPGPLPKSAPPPPLPTSLPPVPPPKTKSPASKGHASKSVSGSLPPRPLPSARSPPRKLARSKSPSGSLPISLPSEAPPPSKSRSYPSHPPPKAELEMSPPAGPSDEDAQAEMIANMLLNMKSSIVGSEMDDPHAALQALLSSKELTEALMATKSKSNLSQGRGERKGADVSNGQQFSHSETKAKKSVSSRDKVAFSFAAAGKSSVPTRNVPQTFLEEESSDEDN